MMASLRPYVTGAGLALGVLLATSRDALACSIRQTPGRPRIGTLAYVRSLVAQADIVVRARAVRYGEGEHYLIPPEVMTLGEGRAIEFAVIEVLTPGPAPKTLYIGGHLMTTDDFNRGGVPYLNVRREGQRGGCVASGYRAAGEFLLILRQAPKGYYTPYWAFLAPTNEQIRGARDPWLHWVRKELRKRVTQSVAPRRRVPNDR